MSKKFCLATAVLLCAVLGLVGFMASPAMAVKEFKDAFRDKYIKPDSSETNDVALAAAFEQASCGICHAGGDNKKDPQ